MSPGERLVDPEARLQHALDLGFRFLGRRDRTVGEVRLHLADKRVEPATIDATVAELERMDYLDDARYAVRFAEDRRTLDAWGPDRIERRLLAVGVGAEHVAAALAARDGAQEREAALAFLRRRFPQPPTSDRNRERALGMLVRKGYDLELAYEVIRVAGREAV